MSDSHPLISHLENSGIEIFKPKVGKDELNFGIKVWAKPGSKLEKISIGQEGELIVHIKEKPVEGKANKALLKALSRWFGPAASQIELDKGGKSRFKRFNLRYVFTEAKGVDYYISIIQKWSLKE